MCDFPSWIVDENTGRHWFLTDKDVIAYCEAKDIYPITWCDFVGHHGIKNIFGICGDHEEIEIDAQRDTIGNIPRKIAAAIRAGKMNKIMLGADVREVRITARGVVHYVKNTNGAFGYYNGKYAKGKVNGRSFTYLGALSSWSCAHRKVRVQYEQGEVSVHVAMSRDEYNRLVALQDE